MAQGAMAFDENNSPGISSASTKEGKEVGCAHSNSGQKQMGTSEKKTTFRRSTNDPRGDLRL
jgi:hypothetical protein